MCLYVLLEINLDNRLSFIPFAGGVKVWNLIIKGTNLITGEDHITGLHVLQESLALCLLHDCLQDVKMEIGSSAWGPRFQKISMVECTASNVGRKGPVRKPMVISFLTHAIITVASFLSCFLMTHWFSCTQAQRFHSSWQPTSLWGKKKDHMHVMKKVKALCNQSALFSCPHTGTCLPP